MNALISLFVMLALLGMRPPSVEAQEIPSEEPARRQVLSAVSRELGYKAALRAAPVPDLEDDLIFLETAGKPEVGGTVSPYTFYRVTIAPYTVREGKIEAITLELDTSSERLAVANSKTNEVFVLSGSGNCLAAFNRLVKEIGLRVSTPAFALNVFDTYLKIAQGEDFRQRVVTDDMKLEALGLHYFRQNFPARDSRSEFEAWWGAIPAATKQALARPPARQLESAFEIRYFLFQAGSLWKRTIRVRGDGTIVEGESQAIVNTPNRTPR